MSYKFKKKPTTREIAGVTIDLGQKLNSLMGYTGDLEKAFSLYIEMKGDNENYKDFIDKKIKEWKEQQNDAKANGEADKPILQGDTDGESSGTEGIREEE